MRTNDSGNLSNMDWKAIAGNLEKKTIPIKDMIYEPVFGFYI